MPHIRASSRQQIDVLFAVVPFADPRRASLGVALLQAGLEARSISTRLRYFNLDFAERIGLESYAAIANLAPPDVLLGEWVFADAVFGSAIPDGSDYVANVVIKVTQNRELAEMAVRARAHCREFVRAAAREIAAISPRIVGFTTTFHQTCACVALAREIKKLPDAPIVVFGGANCEGVMGLELLRQFDCIDYVCTQEGDAVVPAFVESILGDAPGAVLAGMIGREQCELPEYPLLVQDLDSLPIPDYSEYFEQLCASALHNEIEPALQIETSRGCWWGAKHHCTFCGLNGATMAFRRKSPDRVFDEITGLVRRWGTGKIEAVDNILDMRLIDELFPRLAAANLDLELFYEVKSNLRYSQLVTLRAGGLRAIQPGIESFSDQALQLMRKGISGLRNIQLLRWCRELGISVSWNILVGFPDEDVAEIDRMTLLLPKLTHLDQPSACSSIRLDRFSPLFVGADQFGLTRVRPNHAYYYVFPFDKKSLSQLAYFFEYDYEDGRKPDEYTVDLGAAVQHWWGEQGREHPPVLDATVNGSTIDVVDTRAVAVHESHRLEGIDAEILAACDSVQSSTSISRTFTGYGSDAISESIQRLRDLQLLEEQNGHYLSLPVFRGKEPLQERIPHFGIPIETASTTALQSSP